MEDKNLIPKIKYYYMPEDKHVLYVDLDNEFMLEAKKLIKGGACAKQPAGAVIVKDGKIIGRGTNAGKLMNECARWGSATGQNYHLCKEVCHQEGHAEDMAVRDAIKNKFNCEGADIYMYGHWYCCKPCWDIMNEHKIANVYLLYNSWNLFNPEINTEMKDWGKPKAEIKN